MEKAMMKAGMFVKDHIDSNSAPKWTARNLFLWFDVSWLNERTEMYL
jgi:hypothetical protein